MTNRVGLLSLCLAIAAACDDGAGATDGGTDRPDGARIDAGPMRDAAGGADADTGADAATPPSIGGTANPTLLPVATGQPPGAGTYGRGLSSGETYLDPVSGVMVLKVTDATHPTGNDDPGTGHGYSAGGPRISQPWTADGVVYYTLSLESGWLVDVRDDTMAMSNWRSFPGADETGIAFSLDPATPRIVYYVSDMEVHRYDTEANAEASTGSFPWAIAAAGSNPVWLQTQLHDTWIAAMLNSDHTYLAYRTSDGVELEMTEARSGLTHDELHLDRELPYVYMSVDSDVNANAPWNLATDTFDATPTDPTGMMSDDHAAGMKGCVVSTAHWQVGGGAFYYRGDADSAVHFIETSDGFHAADNDWYNAGQWCMNLFGSGAITDLWFAADRWSNDGPSEAIRRGVIALVRLDGDVRYLCAHDSLGATYDEYPQTTYSPDGHLVMWTSDMNGSPRIDVFVARVPSDPPRP